jgi:hypothetical protein
MNAQMIWENLNEKNFIFLLTNFLKSFIADFEFNSINLTVDMSKYAGYL